MVSLNSELTKKTKKWAENPLIRARLITQLELLSKTKYFKKPFKATAAMYADVHAFLKAFFQSIKNANFVKYAKLPALHSLVVTLLIALGDSRELRKKVGTLLEKKSKLPSLTQAFENFPAIYSHALASLPPQRDKEALSVSLLRCV